MKKRPLPFSLVLCERIAFEGQPAKASLVGVFQALLFSEFPTAPQAFTVYTALYGGVGEGTLELEIMRLETEEVIDRYKRWYTCPAPSAIINVELLVKRCIFPAPGRYALTLRFEHEDLTQRYLTLNRG